MKNELGFLSFAGLSIARGGIVNTWLFSCPPSVLSNTQNAARPAPFHPQISIGLAVRIENRGTMIFLGVCAVQEKLVFPDSFK